MLSLAASQTKDNHTLPRLFRRQCGLCFVHGTRSDLLLAGKAKKQNSKCVVLSVSGWTDSCETMIGFNDIVSSCFLHEVQINA